MQLGMLKTFVICHLSTYTSRLTNVEKNKYLKKCKCEIEMSNKN